MRKVKAKRYQTEYRTDADYEAAINNLIGVENKGVFDFKLPEFDKDRVVLLLSHKGKLEIYHHSLAELHGILNILKRHLKTEKGDVPWFKLEKVVPLRGAPPLDPTNFIGSLRPELLGRLIEMNLIVDH